MDDVYVNLENYTEETTKAELREENKNLKSKLEEYATALNDLQKEFDMLSSEHKKLEMNYSSLLKTARSEIERKTQLISKLNIEKDAMVLNSIQNRNTPFNKRWAPKHKPINNKEESKFEKNQTQFCNKSNMKPNFSNQAPNERREEKNSPSANFASSYKNIQPIVNNARNNEVKENITLKNDGEKSRARITSRRKSMPVFSMDCETVNTDEDDAARPGSFKEFTTKEKSGNKYLDRLPNDRPNIEDTIFSHHEYSKESRSSMEFTAKVQPGNKYQDNFSNDRLNIEEKMFVHQEYLKESRSRSSKYDSDKYRSRDNHDLFQRYRRNISPDRRKRSPERRKGSSDRIKRDTRDNSEEFRKRQEFERRRRLVSPPKEKYYHDYKNRNRDSQRSNDRNHIQDLDRYKPRSQDMYTMKHKIFHDYEDQSSKRMRLDSNPKHEEEKWRGERQVGPTSLDLDHLHNMSCQSPDQTHLEALPSHQAREIKLNASTKLEDPRILSKKYTLKTHDGISELSTVESANIDVKVIDTSDWDMIKRVKMPDALLKKPLTSDMPRLKKPMKSDMLDAQLQRQQSTSIPDEYIHNIVNTDVPETVVKKRMIVHIPNDQILNSLNQKPMTADETTPDAFTQKQNPTDEIMFEDSTKKPKPTEEIMPDASTQKPKPTDEIMPDVSTQKPKPTDKIIPDASTQKPKPTDEIIPDASTQTPKFTDDVIPDTSTQKPMCDDLVKEIYMDIENPTSNLSMESGELYNFEDDYHICSGNTNQKITHEITREHVIEPLKTDNGSRKLGNYKIPKKSSDDTNNAKINKDMLSSYKFIGNQKITNESTNNINDSNTDETCEVQERKLPQPCGNNVQYELQNYITSKNIVEGDLELSDEASDNTDLPIKQIPILDNKKDLDTKDSNKKHDKLKLFNQWKIDSTSQNVIRQNLEGKSIETTVEVTRKPKARKKSLKLKNTEEPQENKDITVSIDKPVKKKEDLPKETFENKDISLSKDQLVIINENITQDILEDKLSKNKPFKKKEKVTVKNKESALNLDKTIKKKENKPKELSENKCMVLSIEKPIKQKENSKELLEKKETLFIDKQVKKTENKTKESQEHRNTLSVEKPTKKKQNKLKELSEQNREYAKTIDMQVTNKEYKTKQTKFSELFGDSSSLVSPEDLGLVPTVVAPPENYVAIFEDAQDAIDMNTSGTTVASASMEISNDISSKNDTQNNFNMNVENAKGPTITVEPTYQNIRESVHKEPAPAKTTIIDSMYQNLQPENSSKDIVKTVIISSGTQPQCTLEATETYPIVNNGTADADLHLMQCVKPTVLQDIAMQALATSTPQKTWQQNVVQDEIDPKISSCTNESREARVDETSVIANSDITKNASLTNVADEPDVTIFVKRRRKIARKK